MDCRAIFGDTKKMINAMADHDIDALLDRLAEYDQTNRPYKQVIELIYSDMFEAELNDEEKEVHATPRDFIYDRDMTP